MSVALNSRVVAASVQTTVSDKNGGQLTQASRQWASRPADERFTSLIDLQATVRSHMDSSKAVQVSTRGFEIIPDPENQRDGLLLQSKKTGAVFAPSNWSFGQLAGLAKAPAGYLRTLPAALASDALNYGLHFGRDTQDVGLLMRHDVSGNEPPINRLMAATGPQYGRVWNAQIADALVRQFGNGIDGDWTVPGEFGKKVTVTNDNTTLYASDRDMFVFLADEQNRIEVPNRRNGQSGSMARGFFVWNSEVGSQTFGIAMFLFDYACSNRIVWGVGKHVEMKIRHTASAPSRWIESVMPAIKEYSKASAAPIENVLKAAQEKKVDDLDKFLANRKWTKPMINGAIAAHQREEGRPMESLWDIATGATAYAKTITYQDERVEMERRGGAMLSLAEATF